MLDWILFGLMCYSVGLVTGFLGVVAVFSYAMKRMRSQIIPQKEVKLTESLNKVDRSL